MNKISDISIDDAEKWDRIVLSFKQHDIYYLSGYIKAFKIHGDGEPFLLFYESDNLRCINIVMKRDIAAIDRFKKSIPAATYFDLMTPYGYGGFLFEGNITDGTLSEFKETYHRYMLQNKIVSEFVRYHPMLKNASIARKIFPVIDKGRTAHLDLTSPEIIRENLNPKNRTNIRKAKRNGIQIKHSNDPALFNDFMIMYNKVMQKNAASSYYYFKEEFYVSICQDLRNHYEIIYALLDNTITSMSIFIYANNQMHCHLSCSDMQYRKYAPSNLLIFEAACWGFENKMKTLHLGGGVGYNEDNLFQFKHAFNQSANSRATIGTNIYNEEMYDFLASKQKDLYPSLKNGNSFFPSYRQIND